MYVLILVLSILALLISLVSLVVSITIFVMVYNGLGQSDKLCSASDMNSFKKNTNYEESSCGVDSSDIINEDMFKDIPTSNFGQNASD